MFVSLDDLDIGARKGFDLSAHLRRNAAFRRIRDGGVSADYV
jgi:hypothetical protein